MGFLSTRQSGFGGPRMVETLGEALVYRPKDSTAASEISFNGVFTEGMNTVDPRFDGNIGMRYAKVELLTDASLGVANPIRSGVIRRISTGEEWTITDLPVKDLGLGVFIVERPESQEKTGEYTRIPGRNR